MKVLKAGISICLVLLFISCAIMKPPNDESKPTNKITKAVGDAPTDLNAEGLMDVTLQWDPNTEPDLDGYRIYYDVQSGAPYNGTGAGEGDSPITIYTTDKGNGSYYLSDPDNPEFTVTNLNKFIDWYFAATAIDNEDPALESDYSNEVMTKGTTALICSTKVRLTWSPITDSTIDGFKVFYRTEDGEYNYNLPECTASANSTSCDLIGLPPGKTLYFVVRSFLGNEMSENSNEVNCFSGKPPTPNIILIESLD